MTKEALLNAKVETFNLPQILPVVEFDENDATFEIFKLYNKELESYLPRPIGRLEQKLMLAKLIEEHNKTASITEALDLAEGLINFLATLERDAIPLDKIKELVEEEYAEHWQKIMDILQILSIEWPELLKSKNAVTLIEWQNNILLKQAEFWAKNPPKMQIIAAGLSANSRALIELLKTLATTENSKIVLYGFDRCIDDKSFDKIDELHAQFTFKRLLHECKYNHKSVKDWVKVEESSTSLVLSEAMRTAAIIEHSIVLNNIKLGNHIAAIKAKNLQEEASLIVSIFKKVLSTSGKNAALVTNDKQLALWVISYLRKLDINLNYSKINDLSGAKVGSFFLLILEAINNKFSAIELLSVLKHPLCRCGIEEEEYKELVSKLEVKVLRGLVNHTGLKGIRNYLVLKDYHELLPLIDYLDAVIQEFLNIIFTPFISLTELLNKHVLIVEALAKTATEEGKDILLKSEGGKEFAEFVENLSSFGDNIKVLKPSLYSNLLKNFLKGYSYNIPGNNELPISILTPSEARFCKFDVVIIGGLNEGSWPREMDTNPFLTRSMLKKIGSSTSEERIGVAAHDFYCLSHAEEVIVTRAEKIDGAQTIPSRFLLKLSNVCNKIGYELEVSKQKYLTTSEIIKEQYSPIEPPNPKPKVEYRPRSLSVTQIEKLVKDPYSIYAHSILNLKPLKPLDARFGVAEFGEFIHRVLESWVGEKELNEQELIELGKIILKQMLVPNEIQNLWWPRFENIIKWIILELSARPISPLKIYNEVKGQMVLNAKYAPFALIAKADRIEFNLDNTITIIDYKTGGLPSDKDIASGDSLQMILEALIALNAGFKGLKPQAIKDLIYIQLTGGDPAGEIRPIKVDLDELIDKVQLWLETLINEFDKQENGYMAVPDPDNIPRFGDYYHLARLQEWL
jgi:ATP-dependent helicase/nuclease subunit B